jgi:hypothetical protein
VTILDAAFWAVCLVLVASGATKVAEPESFAAALASFGIGGTSVDHRADGDTPGRWFAVAVGVVEIGIGLNALVLGGTVVAVLAALAYACFAVVVLVARRRGLPSCGCFGARSGTPSLAHAGLNAGSAVVCAGAAVVGPDALADGLDGLGAAPSVLVVLVVLAAASAIVVVDTR